MTDRDVTAAVRTAAYDYGWTPFHEETGVHFYAKRHYELRIYFARTGAVEKAAAEGVPGISYLAADVTDPN